ncbi:MAG: hypothetical protein PHX83_12615 [Acidobacteriia bacterium]|nr:hypothetical protein [Terriglobia bacterium]
MIKSKLILLCTTVLLALILTVPMNAQWAMSQKNLQFFTNNPCSSPFISWVLYDESGGISRPTGGIGQTGDCDPSNYGNWRTQQQLKNNFQAYRQLLARQGLRLAVGRGNDGHAYVVVARNDGILLGIDAGVVGQGGSSIVASGAGNIVAASQIVASGAGNIVASGAGNIVASGAGNIVASGAGNFYGVKALGDTVVQFPGKWVKLGSSNPAPAPQRPNNPYSPPATNRASMIRLSYKRAFGRDPSGPELNYWNGLPASDSRVANLDSLVASHRAYLRSNASERQAMIARSYMFVFRRNPTSGELRYWDQQVAASGTLYDELVGMNARYKAQNPSFR